MNKKNYTEITEKIKIDVALKKVIKKKFSFKQAQELIKKGKIRVNGESVHLSHQLKQGDIVNFYLPIKQNLNTNIKPIRKFFDIVFEDKDILVINKEPNLLTLPHNDSQDEDNLAGRVLAYYEKTRKQGNAIQFLSRLDRETSGLILIAKNSFAHSKMQAMQQNGQVDKRYLLLVHGTVKFDRKNVVLNIKRSNLFDQFEISKNGEYARTVFHKIKNYDGYSLLEAKLFTGKTHQIRLHANAIKHPLLGEDKYFKSNSKIQRFALHSHKLSFTHPTTGKRMELEAAIPEDMKQFIK